MKNVKSTNLKTNATSYIVNAFLASKKIDNLTENSIRFYKSRLKAFADFCGEDFDEIDRGILTMYFDHYAQHHAQSSLSAAFRAVKIFYNWYENQVIDYIDYTNPMRRLKAPRVQQKILDPLSLEDFSKMIRYCNTSRKGIFRQSLLYFLLDSGTRAQEFLSLDISDVDFVTGEVVIRVGKGRKRRSVFIGSKTKKALRAYLKTRTDDEPFLWISSYGNRLSYSGLNKILKTIAEKAGIEPPPSAHDFRRAFCKNMIVSGTNPYVVQILMGWSSYAVMQRYAKLYSDDIRVAHGKSGVDKWL
jgi:integrase/recombinase XerD